MTHRGRRSKGKGPKPGQSDHHEEAKGHMANASAARDPQQSRTHLFKALSSLKKASAPKDDGLGSAGAPSQPVSLGKA